MGGTRSSLWLRWPDDATGPLWIGLHRNERAGQTALVGIELWTEEPGAARQHLGPEGDPAEDLLPWAPVGLRARDLRTITLSALQSRLEAVLSARQSKGGESMVNPLPSALRATRGTMYPPDHFARVAQVYERARQAGSRAPTLAVAEAWNVSRSAAAKWVMRARAAGVLAPVARNDKGPTHPKGSRA